MWSDPVADMLTRIRNAARVRNRQVKIPASKVKIGIARVLTEEGYIAGFDVVPDSRQSILRVDLKYGPRGEDVIHHLRRVSRPGRRVYSAVDGLPKVLDGMGISVVSTNRGVLSDRQCRDQKIGGEVLCSVY